MYYSEYLRNKTRAAPKIISPPRGQDASLWTQIQRYRNSAPVVTPRSAGEMLELSSEGVIAHKGQVAVCCANTIKVPTTVGGNCCSKDYVTPVQFPTNFYNAAKPDCCPVNGPPINKPPCCPGLPANTFLTRYRKKTST